MYSKDTNTNTISECNSKESKNSRIEYGARQGMIVDIVVPV